PFVICILRRHPPSPPFPYTTLFRSDGASRNVPPPQAAGTIRSISATEMSHAFIRADGSRTLRDASASCRLRAQPEGAATANRFRSEEHTSELQSRENLVCRLLLEKK